jgi:hypothetical protein
MSRYHSLRRVPVIFLIVVGISRMLLSQEPGDSSGRLLVHDVLPSTTDSCIRPAILWCTHGECSSDEKLAFRMLCRCG